MAFSKIYQEKVDAIEKSMAEEFSTFKNYPDMLREAMSYSLLSGGKRLRPVLFIEFFELFGGKVDRNVIRMMMAVESVHTYSLIHDDLPCMDNDDFRRGKLTNHKVYGEGVAVLAGDALLNYAYELVLTAIMDTDNKELYAKAGMLFARGNGAKGLIGGQVEDINADEKVDAEKIRYIFKHKTGDLFVSACVCGAMLAGASSEDLEIVKEFASNFSYGFQIRDDLLDYDNKTKLENSSFVKIYGKSRAKEALGVASSKGTKALDELKGDTSFLKKINIKFATRKE